MNFSFANIKVTNEEIDELMTTGSVIIKDKITDGCQQCSEEFEVELQLITGDN